MLAASSASSEPAEQSGFLVLPLDTAEATLELVGGKGESLARLARAGLPVPPGFHVTTTAYRRFVAANDLQAAIVAAAAEARADAPASLERAAAHIRALFESGEVPDVVAQAIDGAYAQLGGRHDVAVAVRSSATAEDLPGASFAGQQESYLNVRGAGAVLDAVKRCWASLWTARAIGYRVRQGIAPEAVSLAVVVQELVPADAAGVLFTAHPVTGARDQVLMNAAWGLGETVVGGLVTPDSFTVNKQTGGVVTQEIADKEVMTVLAPGETRTEPVPDERRRQPALASEQVAALARLGGRIEQLYGRPMDVEWALHGGQIYLLQARPITALPEPAGPDAAAEWQLPHPGGRYVRGSVIELLPDPLSPLFATLGLPEWNAAMSGLLRQFGAPGMLPDDLITTVNGYAYYRMDIPLTPMLRFVPALPRVAGIMGRARERWEREARPAYQDVVRRWEARDLSAAPAAHLVAGAHEIVAEAARHYLAIQSGILPVAYMTESLFTVAYDKLIKRHGDPRALTFLLGYDSAPIRAEKSLYDLATWARGRQDLVAYLRATPSAQIAGAVKGQTEGGEADAMSGAGGATWQEFRRRFADHMAQFGHAIYDLDFAKPLPVDDPAPLFDAIKFFLGDDAPDPYARQAAAAADRERATRATVARLRDPRRDLFRRLLKPAQRFAPLREDALADVGLGWPALRRMVLELGRRLVAAGTLPEAGDVFWLSVDELRAAAETLDAGRPAADYHAAVAERRTAWERQRRVAPPAQLPLKGGAVFLGIDFTRWLPARSEQAEGATIKGTGTSPGRVTAPAAVLHGPEEFDQMRPGDVLVARITTPAWTPLFALAAGVVTDVGGPLSHGSIVAREYHIPAVLGTGVATTRIHGGQRVTVDGDAGTVHLLD